MQIGGLGKTRILLLMAGHTVAEPAAEEATPGVQRDGTCYSPASAVLPQ